MKSIRNSVDKHVVSAILLFVTSSIWQYRCHAVLASLRPSRTTKPSYAAPPKSSLSFQLFLTPHYTAEILIYSAMTLAARNWTMFTALLWVVTNLSVSAGETRIWAHQKFRENEWGRWNIIPFVY
jgi:3-oxo-5-alpha-steroid 4-dehydrogenase 3 / polyprenol reductase